MNINIKGKSKYILAFLLVLVSSLAFSEEIKAQECDIYYGECGVTWEPGEECAPGECESQDAFVGSSGAGTADACYTGSGCPSWTCLVGEDGERDPEIRWDLGEDGGAVCCELIATTIEGHYSDELFLNEFCYTEQQVDYWYEQCLGSTEVCDQKWVCDQREVCDNGWIMFDQSLVRPVFAKPLEECYLENYNCRWEDNTDSCWDYCYSSRMVPVYKDVEICEPFWDYVWVPLAIIESEKCEPAVLSEGDSCWLCTGVAPVEPEPPCDPGVWGGWSTCTETCGGGEQSRVNECGSFDTQACNTQACVLDSSVRGYIWDATGASCTSNPSSSLEIAEGSGDSQISGPITVALSPGLFTETWDPDSFSGYSYDIPDVPLGTYILSAGVPSPNGFPNSKYRLSCVNGTEVGVAAIDVTTNPEIVHLGYKLITNGWFQSIDGDVYGGCEENSCTNSIYMDLPDASIILGGFADKLVAGVGSVFGNSALSVTDSNYSEDDNRRVEYLGTEGWWPSSLTFDVPASATEITDCNGVFSGDLEAGTVYHGDNSCIQDGFDNLGGSYSITGDGVAVVYVTGTGTLTVSTEFTSDSSNSRILFVTEGPVEIEAGIGTLTPTPSTSPHIQASIISQSDITFLSDGLETDTTIIVEGPLVSKNGTVEFNRDRGVANDYPSEVVVYNPLYLTALSDSLPFGVSSVDISWTIGN